MACHSVNNNTRRVLLYLFVQIQIIRSVNTPKLPQILDIYSVVALQSIKSNQVDISFNKCGIAMASNGNINKGIQLTIYVINYKMLKRKYLAGMLSAHPMRLHN